MEMETVKFSRTISRRKITFIVFLVLFVAAAGLLVGYFVMKKDRKSCHSDNDNTLGSNKEKYHRMFQEAIKAKNLEDNLR